MALKRDDAKENTTYDISLLPELLPVYYCRLFPYDLFYKWVCHKNITLFPNREFSFTLKDDVYLRFQSFKDQEQLEKEIKSKNPYKIDIGAIYSSEPKNYRTAANFLAVEKELVFDIDMTDYDDVRTCCTGADICARCWPFMTIAMKILSKILSDDFGLYHHLWVYSGRRGVHCWICDDSAQSLSSKARSVIVEYLAVVKGGEYKTKKVYLGERIHPSIKSSLAIIEEYFEDLILDKQDYLSTEKNSLEQKIYSFDTSRERWKYIKDAVAYHLSKENVYKCKHYIEEVMLQLCYPRLDVNVTKQVNHLLKAPFCVHPKTGRVCVPIDISKVDEFDPFSVPTITQLCEEINAYDKRVNIATSETENIVKNQKIQDYEKTCLNDSIKMFKKVVNAMVAAQKVSKKKKDYTLEF
ncbi:DNA primase small subunit [Centruroides vittatus]|uniref:DNA primase small subunit n=1 Tax=Centruroides vittatus TaxID=120091 RepID=UPI003510BDD9